LAEFKNEEFWFDSTLYLFGITSSRDTHDFFRIVPASPTIIGDSETISRLKQAKCTRLLISLQSGKWENPNPSSSTETVLREYTIPNSQPRLSDLFEHLSSTLEKDYFWREQCFLQENFPRIYPTTPIENHGFIFLSYPKELRSPRQTFQSVHTFDYVLIDNRWVIKKQQLLPVKQQIIDHEFKHILRKLKRQI